MPKRAGSKGRKKPKLRDLLGERLTKADRKAFREELEGASDRACALIGCAFIDNALRDLVTTYMRDDWPGLRAAIFDGPIAPLQSFGSRITVAYALEAIDEQTRVALNAIKNIRNVFAHSEKPITFAHDLIEAECSTIESYKLRGLEGLHVNRVIYISAVVSLVAQLRNSINERRETRAMAKAVMEYTPPPAPESEEGRAR